MLMKKNKVSRNKCLYEERISINRYIKAAACTSEVFGALWTQWSGLPLSKRRASSGQRAAHMGFQREKIETTTNLEWELTRCATAAQGGARRHVRHVFTASLGP